MFNAWAREQCLMDTNYFEVDFGVVSFRILSPVLSFPFVFFPAGFCCCRLPATSLSFGLQGSRSALRLSTPTPLFDGVETFPESFKRLLPGFPILSVGFPIFWPCGVFRHKGVPIL